MLSNRSPQPECDCRGVIACTRLAMSATRKPWGTGEFAHDIAAVALNWLSTHGPESAEHAGCTHTACMFLFISLCLQHIFLNRFAELAMVSKHDLGMTSDDNAAIHERLTASVGNWNAQEAWACSMHFG